MKLATWSTVTALALATVACASTAIRIDGSPGVLPLVAALAAAYEDVSGDRLVLASGLGSSARLDALASGRIDVAMASHGVDSARLAARGLVAREIARTAVVFAVNATVPLRAISSDQVCAILAGRITRWRNLGAGDAAIVALMRPDDEVDSEVSRTVIPCLRELVPASHVRIIARPDSMAEALGATPHAFGVTSMPMVHASDGRIVALTLDGMVPTAENVASGRYSLRRSAFLVTRADPPDAVTRFLDFIASAEGSRIIAAGGAVPAARIMHSSMRHDSRGLSPRDRPGVDERTGPGAALWPGVVSERR